MRCVKPRPQQTIDVRFFVRAADFHGDRCPIELAVMREDWVEDCFSGVTAIDILSTSGKVARFLPSPSAWSVIRKYDRGDKPERDFDVIMPGGRLVYTMPDAWRASVKLAKK